MEKTRKYCAHCHQPFVLKRNPQQHHCGQSVCQNARKRDWRKQQYAADPDYRENQRRADQSWQKRHPEYWRKYRATHTNYAQRNREQQRIRQRQWRLKQAKNLSNEASLVCKGDALLDANALQNAVKPGTYRLIPNTYPEFAKSDALIVTIAVVARV